EVVFDRLLAPPSHDDDLVASCREGFLDAVLNNRLIDDGQHFLGLSFGCREKAGPQAGRREYRFAHSHGHGIFSIAKIFVREPMILRTTLAQWPGENSTEMTEHNNRSG